MKIENKEYDRIISIMTFEHLENLPEIVKKCHKLLKKDGLLQVAIPCEGELAFKLGWKLTTGLSFRLKYGLDYSKIMRHEHLNTERNFSSNKKFFFNVKNFNEAPFYYHSITCLFTAILNVMKE